MKLLKKLFILGTTIALLALAAYGVVRLYRYVIKDATAHIKQAISEGVAEGIEKGVGNTLNPFNVSRKLFGRSE